MTTSEAEIIEVQRLQEENAALKQAIAELELKEAQLQLAKEALRRRHRQKEILTASLTNTPLGLVLWEIHGNEVRIQDWNDSAERIFGWSKAEILGKDFLAFLPAGDDHEAVENIAQAIKTEQFPRNFINHCQNKSGQELLIEWFNTPVNSGDPSVLMVMSLAHDITQQKRMEAERDRFFNLSVDMLCIIDFDGTCKHANPAWTSTFGWTEKELLTRPLLEFIHDDDVDTAAVALEHLAKGQIVTEYECRFACKNGAYRWISWNAFPVLGERLIYAVAHDISYLKQSEDVLKSALRLYHVMPTATAEEIVQAGLEEAVKVTNSKIGFFHFVNPDQRTIQLVTWSQGTLDICTVEDRDAHYPIDSAGVWVECIQQKKPVIHNDYDALTNKKGLPEGHVPLIREVTLPVLEGDKVVAVMGVGNSPKDYTQTDLDQLSLLAENTWSILQRKRSAQSIQESEEQYRTLAEHSPDVILRYDKKARHIYASPNVRQLMGIDAQKVVGKTYHELGFPEERCKFWEKKIRHTFKTGEFQEVEFDYRSKGSYYSINWRLVPEFKNTGDVATVLGIARDITDSKLAEEALIASEVKYRSLFEHMHSGFAYHRVIYDQENHPQDYIFLEINEAFSQLTGLGDEIIGKKATEVLPGIADSDPNLIDIYGEVALSGMPENFEAYAEQLGKWFNISAYCPEKGYFVAIFDDITEKKRDEERQLLANQVLEIINRPERQEEMIHDILDVIKEHTGLEAVGIRLQEGEDYPYFVSNGFPEEFLSHENHICAHSEEGCLLRDENNLPKLDGMCGFVLRGNLKSKQDFFTEGGSFWTNSTTSMLQSTREEERPVKMRNRCHSEGYESVALIPLKSGSDIVGLLQLNDHRENQFTVDFVQFLEGICGNIGTSIARRQAEEAIRRQSLMVETIDDGIIITDPNGVITDWNRGAEHLFGYTKDEVLGKTPAIIHPPEEAPVLTGQIMNSVANEGKWSGEINFVAKDGKTGTCETVIVPLLNQRSEVIATIGINRDITARKLTDQALQESEEKHRTLFETMAQGVVYQDMEGQIVAANPAAERILGLSVDQLMGRNSIDPRWKTIHEDGTDFPGEDHPAMEALRTGQPIRDVMMGVFNPEEDAYRWIIVNAIPQFDDNSAQPSRVFTTFTDISRRKEAELALQKSEQKYRHLLENIPQRVFYKDCNSVYLAVNPSYAEDLDLTLDQIVGMTDLDLFPSHLAEKYREDDQRIMQAGQTVELDEEYELKGESRTIHTVKTPVCDDDGNIVGILGIFWDITDRKKAEEETHKLASIVESSEDAIIGGSIDGRIISWNAGAESTYGFTWKEAIGQSLEIIVPQSKRGELKEILERVRCGEKIKQLETMRARREGELLNVSLTVSPLRDSEGHIIGASYISRDVTERVRAEEALREAHTNLRQKTQELETANADLTQYAYVVSHDIKSPLRAIRNYSDFLYEDLLDSLDDEQKEYLENLVRAVSQAQNLVEDLLQLSRTGRRELQVEEVDLSIFLKGLVRSFELTDDVEINIGDIWPTIQTEPVLLKQIFQNLIDNALKFNQSETRRVDITCSKAQGDYYEIIVQDNGIGIDSQYLDKIFGVFQRLHHSHEYEGTGIGLAIVKKAVSKINGQIEIDSTPGAGTIFKILLPSRLQ